MAVRLSIGRILSGFLIVSLLVFFGAEGPRAVELPGPAAAGQGAVVPGVQAASRASSLFEGGADINVKKDAKVYITSPNIPDNDRLLEAYNAGRPNGGRVQTDAGEAIAAPGLLGLAREALRSQDPGGQNDPAYSLTDAMRDAIWRKQTAARLEALTTANTLRSPSTAFGGCAEGADDRAKSALWTGLGARC